jgi:enolase
MTKIKQITAHEVLDSRGFPTVEAQVTLDNGIQASSMVPSGASTGSREALELRDKDPKRYLGKGVQTAVNNINLQIAPALKETDIYAQQEIDERLNSLDGTENKGKLGANAILAASMACAKAASMSRKQPLYAYLAELADTEVLMPVPMLNILNGGAHADNSVDIQEFMILPCNAPSFREAMRYGVEIYHNLKAVLKSKGLNTNVGDEGGFAPDLPSNEAALEIICTAIQKAGFTPGKEVYLGLDVAASEFYKDGKYHLSAENKQLTAEEWIDELARWSKNYPIISIEDAMDEGDKAGWALLTEKLGNQVQLVGDDLFVTNPRIFREGIANHLANAILIKLNQVGTLTETIQAVQMATKAKYNSIVSHRSGETEDTFIADLAVALGVGQIKTGAPCRSDRTAKYNRLMTIENQQQIGYAGASVFKRWGIK